ncbi:MAG: DUF374 domain-containing protein [Alphaproteobacteria bacterium]|nr:DUF374 domain-containing protein [Alphaproteobacteria bacterium]
MAAPPPDPSDPSPVAEDPAPAALRPAGGPLAPVAAAAVMELWSRSWRLRRLDEAAVASCTADGGAVLAFFHGEQLAAIGTHRHLPIDGMASHSRDGELLARFIARLGYGTIRGSTSRGGREAWYAARDSVRSGRIAALAVDGPRGPRHRPHVGATALAAATGRPVLWLVSHASPAAHLSSWDRFELPAPGARVVIRYGRLDVRATAEDRDGVEAARVELERTMQDAWWALRGGRPPT